MSTKRTDLLGKEPNFFEEKTRTYFWFSSMTCYTEATDTFHAMYSSKNKFLRIQMEPEGPGVKVSDLVQKVYLNWLDKLIITGEQK